MIQENATSALLIVFTITREIIEGVQNQILLEDDIDDDMDEGDVGKKVSKQMFQFVEGEEGGASHYEASWLNKLQFNVIDFFISV